MYKREKLEHYAALSPYLCYTNVTGELSLGYFCDVDFVTLPITHRYRMFREVVAELQERFVQGG
jgi:hypothetical protein